ncbi:hypothetical protein BJY00DRAFT_202996 [Aspergillus carlsbadensis]|nr:hypothetical protein BJY00DRAFT_202996 [Aspergillus carlsbadensis]
MRTKASSISLFNRIRRNTPVDSTLAADEPHLEDSPTSLLELLQRLFRRMHLASDKTKPAVERPRSPLNSEGPRRSNSSTLSDSGHTTSSITQASASSGHGTGSTASTSRRNSGLLHILVRGREEIHPEDALGMNAWLDTGCVKDLMDRRHFDRLARVHNIQMYRSKVDVMPLGGEPMVVYGIARGVIWQLGKGFKTYKSDFYILDMDQFDVLISRKTIFKYKLYNLGTDTEIHLRRTREHEERRLQALREL